MEPAPMQSVHFCFLRRANAEIGYDRLKTKLNCVVSILIQWALSFAEFAAPEVRSLVSCDFNAFIAFDCFISFTFVLY